MYKQKVNSVIDDPDDPDDRAPQNESTNKIEKNKYFNCV